MKTVWVQQLHIIDIVFGFIVGIFVTQLIIGASNYCYYYFMHNFVNKGLLQEEGLATKAWGTKRSAFYDTDHVDPDWGHDSDDEQVR